MGKAMTEGTLPSSQRVEPGSVNIALGEFPASSTSDGVDAGRVAREIIDAFNRALSSRDHGGIAQLFLQDKSYWRDHLALNWELRTIQTREKILSYVRSGRATLTKLEVDDSSAFRAPRFGAIDGSGDVEGVQFFVRLETDIGRGQGFVRLAEEDGRWQIFTLYTTLTELKGFEEPTGRRRTKGVQHGNNPDRKNWKEAREAEVEFEGVEPRVLIIGAGQSGLMVAARLKMLNVPALIIDRNERVGDNWRKRYRQLVLHDAVWYDHMPYVPFPPHWPVFTPKDKLAEFFESYVNLLELNVWVSTEIKSTSWDESQGLWTIAVERTKRDGSVETRTLHPKHVVQATGHSGEKNLPAIRGMDAFEGDLLCHSSEFPGASTGSEGKRAVVVGCCNSGHDIAQDFCERGYDVTIVQRSTTCVVTSSWITECAIKGLYDEDGPPVEDADVYTWSWPSALYKTLMTRVTKAQNEYDRAVLDGLRSAGFGLDNGPDDAGLQVKYYQRGGGYYIDVGASQLIIDGKIKIKQGQEISRVLADGLEFADGSTLEADEVVFATGYRNMRTQARSLFGDAVADRVGDVWGFDGEGEFRTMWRASGHPGLWFMGGNLAISRYFSRLLALQIKALEEGLAA